MRPISAATLITPGYQMWNCPEILTLADEAKSMVNQRPPDVSCGVCDEGLSERETKMKVLAARKVTTPCVVLDIKASPILR